MREELKLEERDRVLKAVPTEAEVLGIKKERGTEREGRSRKAHKSRHEVQARGRAETRTMPRARRSGGYAAGSR